MKSYDQKKAQTCNKNGVVHPDTSLKCTALRCIALHCTVLKKKIRLLFLHGNHLKITIESKEKFGRQFALRSKSFCSVSLGLQQTSMLDFMWSQ